MTVRQLILELSLMDPDVHVYYPSEYSDEVEEVQQVTELTKSCDDPEVVGVRLS